MAETNVELARRGYEAALCGDLDAILELLDPDVKWHGGDPSAPGACHNRDQALAFMRQARLRGGVGELVEVLDAGDRVVVIMRPPAQEGERVPQLSATSPRFVTARSSKWCTTRTRRTRSPLRASPKRSGDNAVRI